MTDIFYHFVNQSLEGTQSSLWRTATVLAMINLVRGMLCPLQLACASSSLLSMWVFVFAGHWTKGDVD